MEVRRSSNPCLSSFSDDRDHAVMARPLQFEMVSLLGRTPPLGNEDVDALQGDLLPLVLGALGLVIGLVALSLIIIMFVRRPKAP